MDAVDTQETQIKSDDVVAIVHVDYEEYKPETYKGVYVTIGQGQVKYKAFSGGGFEKDMKLVISYVNNKYPEIKKFNSSSVDHYQTDSKKK